MKKGSGSGEVSHNPNNLIMDFQHLKVASYKTWIYSFELSLKSH